MENLQHELFLLNEKLEDICNEVLTSRPNLEKLETLQSLGHIANTINMIKREINHNLKHTAIENQWYDALNLDTRKIRKFLIEENK